MATWTVTIDSAAAGTFNVTASDTVTMGGVAVTRTTGDGFSDSDGSDSSSAVKNYEDEYVTILRTAATWWATRTPSRPRSTSTTATALASTPSARASP